MSFENDQFECGIRDKESGCLIPLASLENLPVYHHKTIPADYQDLMGHMNIRWYFDLFARSGRRFFKVHGLDEDYFRNGNFGVFALKHFIQFLLPFPYFKKLFKFQISNLKFQTNLKIQ